MEIFVILKFTKISIVIMNYARLDLTVCPYTQWVELVSPPFFFGRPGCLRQGLSSSQLFRFPE